MHESFMQYPIKFPIQSQAETFWDPNKFNNS